MSKKKEKTNNKKESVETKGNGETKEESKETPEDIIKEIFVEAKSSISSIKMQLTGLTNQLKNLESKINKKMKQLEKENNKNKNKGNRKPSGFANPTKISKELCDFMGLENGSSMARTDVTKYIINYIKKHNLQDNDKPKQIKPNPRLKSLLDFKNEDPLTFFNLQRYMNKHFLKSQ